MILSIVGPTGSGKSELAVEVAKMCRGSVISCDSVQVYKGFNIGSGKVTEDEKQGIPHYLLDILDGNETFTAGEFVQRTKTAVTEIESEGRIPIIAGGTGLYYRAYAYQYALSEKEPDREKRLRDEYMALLEEKGPQYLHSLLAVADNESAKEIDPRHSSRLVRALVYCAVNKKGIGVQKEESQGLRGDIRGVILDMDRELLYERINARVDRMIEKGLIHEVESLLEMGIQEDAAPMKTIGYKEIVSYLKGTYSLEEAVSLIKQSSRRYAKRQITWFKRHEELTRMPYNSIEDKEKVICQLLKYLNKID